LKSNERDMQYALSRVANYIAVLNLRRKVGNNCIVVVDEKWA
jgi:hypothetical protein